MRSGRARKVRGRCGLIGLFLFLGCGCATQSRLEQALRADGNPAAHAHDLDASYCLRCPDVLDVRIDGFSERSGMRPIEADGRIGLDAHTRLRVVGQTTSETAHAIAQRFRLPDPAVHVEVAEYNSQSLYLFGEIDTVQRVVPYHGPETILDLLQRLGGTSSGSALGDVQVVRPHIADGKAPEVFHVNLSAILFDHDLQTNVCLEPFDRIYIAQSRGSRLACCVPPLFRPIYRLLCGIE